MNYQDGVEDGKSSAGRESAWDWLTAQKHPTLLPTPWLTDTELEEFTEVLLFSERLLGSATRHVQHVERWGVSGDKQDGIDLFGRFNDGTPAAWQVKQLKKLSRGDVQAAVRALKFDRADEFYLVYGGIASVQARETILKYPRWTLLDRQTLTEMLRLLPKQTQQDIIERFWGTQVRRQFVTAVGDALIPFDQFKLTRLNPDSLLNDLGNLAGRKDEIDRMTRALRQSANATPQILVISAPGGRGKTRLLVEVLTAEVERDPSRAIACLAPNRVFDAATMNELRPGPGILVIDDAHNDPPALEPLLAFVRSHPELRLILATRPSGLPAIQGAVARASFSPDEHLLIPIGELDLKSARKIVIGLTADIKPRFGLRNYLAEQARHSPHVVVILTSLIRKGQLSGSIAVNDNLRNVVLARYQEVMIPDGFEGFDRDTVHRVIATYACLQPASGQVEDAQAQIAKFCGLSVIHLARLTRQLIDRGVIVDHDDRLRVVPDVLADQIVEDVAVVERLDTGFVAELWLTFGHAHYRRLAVTLGELDWRIGQRGGPAIMAPVWGAIRDRLSSPYSSSLSRQLDQIAPLAATQPVPFVAALEDVRARLDLDDASQTPEMDDPESEGDQLYRQLWPDSRPTSRADVRAKLPRLYGQAAVNDPATLETAIDALLALACADLRPPHSHPEHARRVLSDELSNLATLPDLTYPSRIVACVKRFCATHSDAEAAVALSALKPLLVKEELETVQSALYEMSFQPHLISATAMRPVRDQIRALLLEQGTSSRLKRAGGAVDLLQEALRPPHGYFGNAVSAGAVLSWEDDDLATLSTIADIAACTQFVTIRRLIRNAVDWSAEHAESLLLQHTALSLQHQLDSSEDIRDALADRVIGSPWKLVNGKLDRLPNIEELKMQRDTRRSELEQLTDAQRNEDDQTRARAKINSRRDRISDVDEALARRVLGCIEAPRVVGLLGELSAEAQQLGKHPSFRGVWQAISRIQPALVPELVQTVAGAVDDHPLDQDLPVLIIEWSLNAIDEVLTWASDAVASGRPGVRLAIAAFVDRMSWTPRQDEFTHIWRTGIEDPEARVATAFLSGAGWYLEANPQAASATLLAHEIPPAAAANALMGVWRSNRESAPIQRDRRAHSALLSVAARAGLNDFTAQEILTIAARAHPDLALDFLLELGRQEATLPDDIYDLGPVFEEHADALSDWLLDNLREAANVLGSVVTAALNNRLTPEQARSLTTRVPQLSSKDLITLVRSLGSIRLWVPSNIELADVCVGQAEASDVLDEVLLEVRRGVTLSAWGWVGNESAELNDARDACKGAIHQAKSGHLREQLGQAAEWFQQIIDELRVREREEDW